MKHRERVLMALNHQEPDRCPMQVSFTPEFAARLRRDLGLSGPDIHNPHGGGNPYDLELALDQDLLLTSVGWANEYYQSGETYTDEWGVGWRSQPYETPFGIGHYTEMVVHPLADEAAVDSYVAPDPKRPELYADAERLLREYRDEYWIVGVTVCTVWETAWALRGFEQMLMDLHADPDLADRILEIAFRYHLTAAEELTRRGVDMIWTGDDIGMQTGMLISPAAWRRFLKPRMAELIARVKWISPQVKVAYHSDGAIWEVIPDLIDIGLDVLNPIQPKCMDPAEVKRRYGENLCFWGSIDEQETLPFGSPESVRAEVLERLHTLGKGGGLIIGPTHHVQLDTPLENFWAMIDTIRRTGYAGGGRA
jgi:uroporphyrinogen decarboxylase